MIISSSSYYTSFERNKIEAEIFRARIIGHVKAEFARQHRTFVFQVILINNFARLVRWDHSGAVVTERFDYVLHPELLAEFLWRFNHMTDEQRGFDANAQLGTPTEKRRFEHAVTAFLDNMNTRALSGSPVRKLHGAERTLDDSKTYPTWKVHVVDAVGQKSTDFIVRRPFSENSSLWGRATRAYLAYDLAEERLVCLKDTWRLDDPDLRPETSTFRELKSHEIPHVPEVLYGGDVHMGDDQPQETLSQTYAEHSESWRVTNCRLEKHVHHRLVQAIAYPLDTAVDEKEFMHVLHDVLHGTHFQHETLQLFIVFNSY